MAVPGPIAEDASAAQDAGRWVAILGLRLEVVPDCLSAPMAWARDFPWVTAERGRLPLLADRYARKPRLVQLPQDDWPKAVYRKGRRVAQGQTAAPLLALLALQPAPDDEWEWPKAWSLWVQQASRPAAPLQAQERAACAPLEQPLLVLPVRSALLWAQRKPLARSVLPRLAPHSLAEELQVRQVSSAQPSQLRPSPLFPLWQPLPLALLLRQRPESFCGPSQRRPRESSSSASSSP